MLKSGEYYGWPVAAGCGSNENSTGCGISGKYSRMELNNNNVALNAGLNKTENSSATAVFWVLFESC